MSDQGLSPVQQCPKCTALIERQAKHCRNCGHLFAKQSRPVSRWSLPIIGGGVLLAVVSAVLALGWPHAQVPVTAEVAAPIAPQSHPSVIVELPPVQHWVGRRQTSWARDGSKTISFALQASKDVPVWMTRARPQLVVRCLSRTPEVYVSLGSAASIEAQAGSHTVRIQIDDDPVVIQQWSDSESSQELFSPDAVGFIRRLADAHRLQFGFTPFNALPGVADFSVQGFDELAPLVVSTCGLRLDGSPVVHSTRSARLK
jgi:ribosomal protein L40E